MNITKRKIKDICLYIPHLDNKKFLSRHPELEHFDFPKTFYFKYCPDRLEIHWAIIKEIDNKVKIYFINNWGRVFDELEFKKKKIAQRQLRKNGFDFSTNRFCPFLPPEPIYIKLSKGKKSAPYSKGNLWKKVQRNKKDFDKLEKIYVNYLFCGYYQRKEDRTTIIQEQPIVTKNKDKQKEKIKKLFNAFCSFLLIILILFGLRQNCLDFKKKKKIKPQPTNIEYKQEKVYFKKL